MRASPAFSPHRRLSVPLLAASLSVLTLATTTSAQPIFLETAKVVAADGADQDQFGVASDLDGDRLVVAAWGADVGGMNDQGAVYVFEYDGATDSWVETAKLTASDGAAGDQFGVSVDLDGDRLVVGAHFDDGLQGAAYVFDYDGGTMTWSETTKLTASDGVASDVFGQSVALDGDRIVVGAQGEDAGPPDVETQGSVYVFDYDAGTTTWNETDKLTASDGAEFDAFGWTVRLDGDRLAVSALFADIAAAAGDEGAVYVFDYDAGTTTWNETQKLAASDGAGFDNFGQGLALDGDRLVVGAHGHDDGGPLLDNRGAAYVFDYDAATTTWSETTKLLASDAAAEDGFGWTVSLEGGRIVVGAFSDDVGGVLDQGSAYVFDYDAGTMSWSQTQQLAASDGAADAWFGISTALDGDRLLVGANKDDIGINDNQGSAYVFDLSQAAALIEDLADDVIALGLPAGLQNSLTRKLRNAIANLQAGDPDGAVAKLTAFINQVEALRGRQLTGVQADALIADAEAAIAAIQGAAPRSAPRHAELASAVPDRFALESAYPNPFNPATTVAFAVPERGEVRVAVFDLLGREVSVLAAGVHEAGRYTAVFEAGGLPSGTYLVRMTTPEGAFTRKVLLMK